MSTVKPSGHAIRGFAFLVLLIAVWAAPAHSADFAVVRSLLGGGFSYVPADYPHFVEWGGPAELGTRRMRLINIDRDTLKGISPSGQLDIHWSQRFEKSLQVCKNHHWIPRIVWGLNPPGALMKLSGPGGRKYGPSSWNLYDKYTAAMLTHVTKDWGFNDVEIVVGNEFNGLGHVREAWFVPDLPVPGRHGIWRESLGPYMTLYAHTAKAVESFRAENPSLTIKIGGPAESGISYSRSYEARPGYFNWLGAFVEKATAAHLPLDFVDWHEYDGESGSGRQFQEAVADIRRRLRNAHSNATISIDEWGFSSSAAGRENREPVAGAFALDFIYTADLSHVDDAMYLILAPPEPSIDFAALFYKQPAGNWAPSYAFTAMASLAKLAQGRRAGCSITSAALHCFAAQDANGGVRVLVWAFNWLNAPAAPQWKPSMTYPIAILVKNVRTAGSYRVLGIKVNGAPRPGMLARITASGANGSLRLSGLVLRAGDYAEISAGGQ